MINRINQARKKGGRGYAVALTAIFAGTFVVLVYLAVAVWKLDPFTVEAFTPLGWYFAGVFAVGGALQLPNAAERWRGGYTPYEPTQPSWDLENK